MKKIHTALLVASFIIPSISLASIDTNLKYGSRGLEVTELQEFLIEKGLLGGQASGNFFSLTRKAVIAYQTSVRLPATGFVGPMTRTKINDDLSHANASAISAEIKETGTITSEVSLSPITTTSIVSSCLAGNAFSSTTGKPCLLTTATSSVFKNSEENRATTTPSGTIPATPAVSSNGGGSGSGSTTPATPAVPAQTQDTIAPMVSNIQAISITESSATITWTTNESSDSKVYFSPVVATSTPISTASTLVTSHSVSLGSLSSLKTYSYVVTSKDASGNIATSSEQSFATTAHIVRPDPTGVRQTDRTLDKIYWELGFSSGRYTIENVEVREMPDCVFDQSGCTVSDFWNQQPKLGYPVYTITEGGDIPSSPIYFNQKFLITVSSLIGDKRYGLVYDIVDPATGYRWSSDFWGIGHPTFTVRGSVTGNGTITPCIMSSIGCPSGYSQTFRSTTSAISNTPWGTTETYYITPDAGFVGSLTVDGALVGTSTPSYTFSNIMANHTIDVIFAPAL